MLGLDPFIEKAFEKIKDAGLAPVYQEQINLLRDHLAYMSEKMAAIEKELARAEGKLETQTAELEKSRSRLALYEGKAVLVEVGPCFVKETSDGMRLEGVYCPSCHMPMHKGAYGYNGDERYQCMNCPLKLPCEIVDTALAAYDKGSKNRH